MILLILISSYMIGAIPFGLIIGKYLGKNPQKHGSGNIGATNMLRLLGKKVGFLVFALDFIKCFALVLITKYFYNEHLSVLVGCITVIGHMFSPYIKFKGGKGVSSIVGLYFGLNYGLGLIFIAIWLAIFKVFRYSSLSSIASIIFMMIPVNIYYDHEIFSLLLSLTVIITLKHKDNIIRIINKKERKF